MGRSRVTVWAAWTLSFGGGVALLVAAFLVARVDLAAACATASGCASALSPTVRTLAFGGMAAAALGGVAATALTLRRPSEHHESGPRHPSEAR